MVGRAGVERRGPPLSRVKLWREKPENSLKLPPTKSALSDRAASAKRTPLLLRLAFVVT